MILTTYLNCTKMTSNTKLIQAVFHDFEINVSTSISIIMTLFVQCPFFLMAICILLSVYGFIYGFRLPLWYLYTFLGERHILHKLSATFYVNKSLRSM